MNLRLSLRSISNTRITLATQVLSGIIASISLIAGARFCGAVAIGQGALLITCSGVLADVVDFGKCSWVSREVASGRTHLRDAKLILHFRTKILFSITIVFAVVNLLFFNRYIFLLGILVYPMLYLQTNYIQQLLFAKDKVKKALLLQILEKISWLVIFPLQQHLPNKLLLFISPVIFGGVVHVGIGRLFLSRIEDADSYFNGATNAKAYFGIQSLVTDLGMFDTVLVGLISSMSNAGIYNLGARVRAPFLLLFNSLISNLKKSFAEHDLKKVEDIFAQERLLLIVFYSSIPLASVLLFTKATDIFGNDFLNLNRCLGISVLSVIPQSLLLLSANFLISAGEEKFVSNFSTIFTFVNLFLLTLGLSIFNMTALGAAIYFCCATSIGAFFVVAKAVNFWTFLERSKL